MLNTATDWLLSIRNSSVLKSNSRSRGSMPSHVSVKAYSSQKNSRYNQFDSGAQDSLHLTSAEGGRQEHDHYAAGTGFPMDRIAVHKTVDIV